jgi:beta-glucanase (GH16 family)
MVPTVAYQHASRPGAAGTRRRRGGIGLAVAGLLVGTLLVAVSPAAAVNRSFYMGDGGTLSVRSSDGCRIRVVKTTYRKTARRDYTCVFVKKHTLSPLGPNSARQVMMANGDVVTVMSADGCKVKPVKTGYPTRWRRDLRCLITGRTKPPPVTPPPVSTATGQPPTAVTGGATWRAVFSDDFNGTAVDGTKWNVPNNSNFGSGNDEDQCYRSANVTVSGGTAKLTAKRQTVSGCGSNPQGGSTYYFTSGMLTTRGQDGPLRMKFTHGYAEVQMRVPRGNAYWDAFWLAEPGDGTSPGWPAYGEIDVSEIYGARPDVTESNFHRTGGDIGAGDHNVNSPPSSNTGISINPPNAFVSGGTNNWHRYGINWTDNKMQWFVDGVLVRTYNASSTADLNGLSYSKSIILNLALGGGGPQDHGYTGRESGGAYNNGNLVADLPGTMEIDYVRVWQP